MALKLAQDLVALLEVSLAKLGDLIHGAFPSMRRSRRRARKSLAHLPAHERREQAKPVEGGYENVGRLADAEWNLPLAKAAGRGEQSLHADRRKRGDLRGFDDDGFLLPGGRKERLVQTADGANIQACGQRNAAFRALG